MSKTIVVSDELYDELIGLAEAMTCREDDPDFNPDEWSGGNFDDCYELGVTDGEILLARKIVEFPGEIESAEGGGDL